MPPRKRPKTRMDELVDVLTALDKAERCLHNIDLRTTPTELRARIKDMRTGTADLRQAAAGVIQDDVPSNPLRARAAPRPA